MPDEHRPYPKPTRPWVLAMRWHDLLFAHRPVDPDRLRPHIPQGLTLETFGGQAWLGTVPFWMSGVRPRFLSPLPWLSRFPELNLRTYVTDGTRPGVWFFSLDASNPVAVRTARMTTHLPYFDARMRVRRDGDAVRYASERTHRGEPPVGFRGWYRPSGPAFRAEDGSLEAWLTERYCLYSADHRGRVYRCDIHHAPWPLQRAEAEIEWDTLSTPLGVEPPQEPLHLLFARRQAVVAWWIERVM